MLKPEELIKVPKPKRTLDGNLQTVLYLERERLNESEREHCNNSFNFPTKYRHFKLKMSIDKQMIHLHHSSCIFHAISAF